MRVEVTATNDEGTETALSDPSAVVAAVAPSNDALPTLSGTPTDGETLTADPGSWDGTGPFEYDYQWQRCDEAGANCVDIPGATGPTYELGDDDAGQTVRVEVTATNDEGTETAFSDPSAVVAAVAPSNDALPTLSGTPTDGETLTADPGVVGRHRPVRVRLSVAALR